MSSARNLHKPSYREVSDDQVVERPSTYKWLFLVVLIILLIVAGLIGFFRQPALQITTVEVEGPRSLDPVRVQESAASFIAGFHVWVVPRSNVLLVSKSAWAKQLLHTIPTLEFVSIELLDRTRAVIHVVERDPMYVWCTEGISGTSGVPSVSTASTAPSTCYFVDDNGYVFEPAPVFSDGVYLIFRGGPLSENPEPLRNVVAPKNSFSAMKTLLTALRTRAMDVTEIVLLPEGDIKVLFDSLADSVVSIDAYLLVKDGMSSEKIVQMLDLMMQDPAFDEHFKSAPGDLEYIDFRFENKIIYKWKGGGETTQGGN